tara:strand:+ start:1040 stop:1558 length:519 start_codon:yes stop_codon:yes gene_type:complete
MSIDASTLPFSPTFFVVLITYGAISAYGTGPQIIARENIRDDWQATCQADLVADLETTRRADRVIPQVPDVGGMLCSAIPELSQLCEMIPNPNTAAREAERRLREAEDARILRAAASTASACSCAEQVFLGEEFVGVALYAASGRLLESPVLQNRTAALTRALHSPACQLEG